MALTWNNWVVGFVMSVNVENDLTCLVVAVDFNLPVQQ